MDRTINIFGTDYRVVDDESIIAQGFDGRVSVFEPTIRIRPYKDMLEEDDTDNEKKACYREVLRHECIHAVFRETGNEEFMNDERLVQVLAALFPKINRLFGELGIQS